MRSRRTSRSGIVFATVVAVSMLTAPAGAADAGGTPGGQDTGGTPGGQSIGDPYYPTDGNTGYQVDHYDLRLNYTPGADHLAGTATILATATQDLSSFSFDFGLHADSVLVDSAPAMYHEQDGKLVVTPRRDHPEGQPMTVVVRYHGTPSKVTMHGNKLWVATKDGALAAQEPHIAAFWYPVNDHPLDKATYDVSVAVPDGTQVVSNGSFEGTGKQRAGATRWNWRSVEPQAPYLTFLAIGNYDVRHEQAPNGQPFVTAYENDLGASKPAAVASVERTPEILRWESGRFGPYPFHAQGGVVSTHLGFALEDQTRPVYSAKFFADGADPYVIVHENAHQWFGDSVSIASWRDIWLNEGFAGFAEWLWSEHTGEGTTAQLADYSYTQHDADDPFWQVLPADPGPEHQFSDAVYDRGAMALEAFRARVGDDAFFATLRDWAAGHRNGNGTIEQFIALAEQDSGQPLYDLFHTWLFTKGKPAVAPSGATAPHAMAASAAPGSYAKIEHTNHLLATTGG